MHAEPIVEDQAPLNLWMPDANRVHLHIWIVVEEEPMLWLMRNRCSDSRNMQHLPRAASRSEIHAASSSH